MSSSTVLFQTITYVIKALFDHEEANLAKREQGLIAKNSNMGGSTDGFRHIGVIYSQLARGSRKQGTYTPLNRDLVGQMNLILAERKVLAEDRERIKQALALVLKGAHSWQDIRDALPNCLRDVVPEIRSMERTRPEAFTLADNPRSYTQYMKLREKLEFYVAARLLY